MAKNERQGTLTSNQVFYLQLLISEHHVPQSLRNTLNQLHADKKLNRENIAVFSEIIQTYPKNTKMIQEHSRIVGYHHYDNDFYRVYRSKNGSMYVKIIEGRNGKYRLEMMPNSFLRKLSVKTLLSNEEAQKVHQVMRRAKAVRD